MVIDGRELQVEETLKKVGRFLSDRTSLEETVEVLVKTPEEVKKLRGYVSMNGCVTEHRKADGYYSVLVSGGTCRCG